MNQLRLKHIRTLDPFFRYTAAWNDLWDRSAVASPSAQAEPLAHWVDSFADPTSFQALVATEGDRFVAALPLVGRRIKSMVRVASLPCNEWSSGGELLVDPSSDVSAALDLLADGLTQVGSPLCWFDNVPYEQPHWQAWRDALQRTGRTVHVEPQMEVAEVEIGADWQAYEASRKGDHRRNRRRYARKLAERGEVTLETHAPSDDDEIRRLIQIAFECEDRSWKGAAGTSVLKTPGMLAFYQEQAILLARREQLEISFLKQNGAVIAFVYGWKAKGVRFIAKIGYDESFRQFGPGQQVVMHLLERLHGDGDCRLLDFWGPLADWNESWATRKYPVGRIVAADRSLVGRGLFYAYAALRPRWKRLRGIDSAAEPSEAAA